MRFQRTKKKTTKYRMNMKSKLVEQKKIRKKHTKNECRVFWLISVA